MKTNNLLRGFSLSIAAGVLLASCGGGGGGQKIPGGTPNFSVELSQILSPQDGDTIQCLQLEVIVEVPKGELCSNPSKLRDAIYVHLDGSDMPVSIGVVHRKTELDTDSTCTLSASTEGWLLEESKYYVSTEPLSFGSKIGEQSSARAFFTPSFEDNISCPNALAINDKDSSWRETSLLTEGLIDISSEGEVDLNTDDLGPIAGELLSGFILSELLGLSSTDQDDVVTVRFNYQPDDTFLGNHIKIRRVEYANLAQVLAGNFEESVFESVDIDECYEFDGGEEVPVPCKEIYQGVDGYYRLALRPDNTHWETGYVYFIFVLETLQAVNGRYMNLSYVKALNVQ